MSTAATSVSSRSRGANRTLWCSYAVQADCGSSNQLLVQHSHQVFNGLQPEFHAPAALQRFLDSLLFPVKFVLNGIGGAIFALNQWRFYSNGVVQ